MMGRLARLALWIVGFAIVCVASSLDSASAAQPEKRVALVIGNNDYQNFEPLTNPVNDAENLKSALESINFDVVFVKNTTLRQFYQALKEFNKRARDADVALVYYAGHAVQFRGRNYLIQVDDEAETLDDINIGSIPVDKLLDVLSTVKGVKVLVLDACRNNPAKAKETSGRSVETELTRDVGLARLDEYDTSGGAGMVIAYATSSSHVAEDGQGKNSPYNIALVKWITAPDMTIPDIFTNVTGSVVASTNQRQHPIFDSSLTGKYILNPTGSEWVDWANIQNSTDLDKLQRFLDAHPDSAHAPFVKHQVDVLLQTVAETTWDRLKDGSDLAALQAFKDRFPNSPHATDADRKIASLRQKAEDAEREAQAWERAKGASDLEAVQAFRSTFPNSSHAAEADRKIASLRQALDDQQRADSAWERLKASTDIPGLQAFRSTYPNSAHGAEAAARIAELQRNAADAQKEITEWARIKDLFDPAALQNFLDRYPNSQFAAEAGRKLVEAQQKIEAQRAEKAWDQVKNSGDVAALERFRYAYPNSPHAAEVDQKIAAAQEKAETERSEKAWAELRSSSDVAALQAFRDRYPRSPHVAEAERRIGDLQPHEFEPQLDEAVAWDHARTANSVDELQAFKHFFSHSPHLGEADKLIAQLQSAAEAEKQKQAAAEKAEKERQAEAEKAEKERQAQAEKAEKERQAEAEKAKQAEEACTQEAADVADFVKARSEGALTALRARATCPKAIAAIDEALREIKKTECDSEAAQVRDIGSDLDALRNAVGGFTCETVIAGTRLRIGQLEQEATRRAKLCDDAIHEVDNGIDVFAAGAREKLGTYQDSRRVPVCDCGCGREDQGDRRARERRSSGAGEVRVLQG